MDDASVAAAGYPKALDAALSAVTARAAALFQFDYNGQRVPARSYEGGFPALD